MIIILKLKWHQLQLKQHPIFLANRFLEIQIQVNKNLSILFQSNLETRLILMFQSQASTTLCKQNLSSQSLCLAKIVLWMKICFSQFNQTIEILLWLFHRLPRFSVSILLILVSKLSTQSLHPMKMFLLYNKIKKIRINMPTLEYTRAHPIEK
jgi:hypothetical protein